LTSQRLILAVPILAVAIVGGLLYANYVGSLQDQPAQSFRTFLLIDVQQDLNHTRRAYPNETIGQPGGIMNTTKYLADGLSGRYPLFTQDSTGVVYVQSRVMRAYTLGDFFQVWGEPLGPNDTLNIPWAIRYYTCGASGTDPCAPFYWTMCIHNPTGGLDFPLDDWGAHSLKNDEIIRLSYSQIGCG